MSWSGLTESTQLWVLGSERSIWQVSSVKNFTKFTLAPKYQGLMASKMTNPCQVGYHEHIAPIGLHVSLNSQFSRPWLRRLFSNTAINYKTHRIHVVDIDG